MPKTDSLSRDTILELFRYDEDTGKLFWAKPRRGIRQGDEAGCLNSKGYRVIRIDGVLHSVHRIIYLLHTGEMPEIVDHINHDRSDNRFRNLRAATISENNANTDLRSDNKSGFKGVSYHKGSGKWIAKLKGKTLGYFKCPTAASLAYVKRAKAEFGIHFNDTTGQKADRRRY